MFKGSTVQHTRTVFAFVAFVFFWGKRWGKCSDKRKYGTVQWTEVYRASLRHCAERFNGMPKWEYSLACSGAWGWLMISVQWRHFDCLLRRRYNNLTGQHTNSWNLSSVAGKKGKMLRSTDDSVMPNILQSFFLTIFRIHLCEWECLVESDLASGFFTRMWSIRGQRLFFLPFS